MSRQHFYSLRTWNTVRNQFLSVLQKKNSIRHALFTLLVSKTFNYVTSRKTKFDAQHLGYVLVLFIYITRLGTENNFKKKEETFSEARLLQTHVSYNMI